MPKWTRRNQTEENSSCKYRFRWRYRNNSADLAFPEDCAYIVTGELELTMSELRESIPVLWSDQEKYFIRLQKHQPFSGPARHNIACLGFGSSDKSHSNEQGLPRRVFSPCLRHSSDSRRTDHSVSAECNPKSCASDRYDSEAYHICRSAPICVSCSKIRGRT